MVELADKNFKAATINMLKELKKNMNMRSEQIENFNKKRNEMYIFEMKKK